MTGRQPAAASALPPRPGDYLRGWFRRYGVSQASLCREVGLSQKHLSAVMTGKTALTAWVAVLIEESTGLDADALMGMQVRYDVAYERACLSGSDRTVRQERG